MTLITKSASEQGRTRRASSWARSSKFADVFLALSQFGLWGFPVRLVFNPESGKFDKKPLVKRSALQKRRPFKKEVSFWLANFQRCAVGLATGRAMGFFVIDCDSARSRRWLLRHGEIITWTVRTTRGWHYYFTYPDFKVANSASVIARGVDVRGESGFVVGAGSFFATASYAWLAGKSPSEIPLAEAPAWLLDKLKLLRDRAVPATPLIASQPYNGHTSAWAQAAYNGEIERLRTAPEGRRNDTLLRVAHRLGQLVAGGELEQAKVLSALHYIADQWSSRKKSYETIRRGFTHGLETPCRAPALASASINRQLGARNGQAAAW
jgi:hypothetical protein